MRHTFFTPLFASALGAAGRALVLALLLTLSAGMAFHAQAAEKRKIIVGVRNNYAGLAFMDEKNNFTGLEAEALKRIFQDLPQYEFEWRYLEQRALFPSLMANKVDIIQGNLRRNTGREQNAIRTRVAHFWSPYVIIVPATNTTIHGLKDLEGKKVVQNRNSAQAGILQTYIKETGSTIDLVFSAEQVAMLANGLADAYIGPIFLLPHYNKSFGDFKVKWVGEPVGGPEGTPDNDPNVYFWFRPEDAELRDQVSAAVEKLRKDGSLSAWSRQFFDGNDYPSRINAKTEKELTR
jgi:ABC-type amino acid transport substrate-binding protein